MTGPGRLDGSRFLSIFAVRFPVGGSSGLGKCDPDTLSGAVANIGTMTDELKKKHRILRRCRVRNIVLNLICLALAGSGLWWTASYFWRYVRYEVTNDAFVDQYVAPLNIRVSGYIREVHVYTGTKADKKRALEASDIGTLVRGTEMDLSKRIPSSSLQKAKMLFVFMFMMRGLPFVDLAFLHKKDLQGNVLSYRRRKTGRTLRVLLSPEALQLVHMVSNKDENSPYLFPILRSKDGTEAAYKEYQSALRRFNYQLSALKTHLNMSSHLSSYSARHTWATMAYYCEIHPGIISEAMGHSSINVTETYLKPFNDKKIDEANEKVISFVKSNGISA